MKKTHIYTLMLVSLLLSVGVGLFTMRGQASSERVGVPIVDIAKDYMGGAYEKPENHVVTNNKRWQQLWGVTFADRDPLPVIVDIDFDKESVVAVYTGEQVAGGVWSEIEKIERTGRQYVVHVNRTELGPGCGRFGAVTHPHHIVRTPKIAGKVTFNVKNGIIHCD